MRRILSVLVLLGLFVPMAAMAQLQPEPAHRSVTPDYNADIYDPIEPFNRAVFMFNRGVDFLVIKPVTTVYTTIIPQFIRNGISNFLGNLGTPVVMINSLLQGNWTGFETSLHRLVINTTLGMGGVNDVASSLGVMPVRADFGQTLGKWGLGQGFYLVLPIIGPSSARDGSGRLVDAFAFDPYNVAFMDSETEWPVWTRAGLTVVDARARYGEEYDRIMKTAVDPYVTFRSIYAQRRAYLVQDKAVDAYAAAEAE